MEIDQVIELYSDKNRKAQPRQGRKHQLESSGKNIVSMIPQRQLRTFP